MSDTPKNYVYVYLDDHQEPIASYAPPVRFELDTTQLEDGPHVLRVEAYDAFGHKGVRTVPFTVRNGPGIAVEGIAHNDVLDGTIPILVNSYGGANEPNWEPSRAETPAPIPTWIWVLVVALVAWGTFYFVGQWNPTPRFADSPTYQPLVQRTVATPEPPSAAQLSEEEAKQASLLYANTCAGCHMLDGAGMPGVFPPLAGDPVVLADDPTEHVRVALNGAQGSTINDITYSTPMPGFGPVLSDKEIMLIVNHERTSWGNDAPLVTENEVAQIRAGE